MVIPLLANQVLTPMLAKMFMDVFPTNTESQPVETRFARNGGNQGGCLGG